jgi:hypothetical protein
MNDFSDLESRLRAVRPAPLDPQFIDRVEQSMANPAPVTETPDNVIRPVQFRARWIVGLGLAAAAAILLLLRINFEAPVRAKTLTSNSPAPTATADLQAASKLPDTFIPAGSTQVVLHKRDEGLLFAKNDEEPVRRLRSITQETLQWKNPATGASLRVSYPSEQVQLVPISAQ